MIVNSISPSFGTNRDVRPVSQNPNNRQKVSEEEYYNTFEQTDYDTCSLSNKRKAKAQQERMNLLMRFLAFVAGAALAGGCAFCVEKIEDGNEMGKIDTFGNNVYEVAEFVDVPHEILFKVNSMGFGTVANEMYIPERYDGLESKIEEYKAKLEKDLSETEKEKCEEILASLIERKNLQDKLGETYVDERGKTAYIYLFAPAPIEDIKYAWGIDDGIVQQYNSSINYDGVNNWNSEDGELQKTCVQGIITLPVKELNPVRN